MVGEGERGGGERGGEGEGGVEREVGWWSVVEEVMNVVQIV